MKEIGMRALLVVLVAFLTGCAGMSMQERPDGTFLGMTTVWHMDRSLSETAYFEKDGLHDDGKPRFKEITKTTVIKRPDGSTATEVAKDRHVAVGPTVAGQAAVAVVGGVATGATQGFFAVRAAKVMADAGCKGDACGTQILNVVEGATALSASQATARTRTRVDGSLSCGTNCTRLAE